MGWRAELVGRRIREQRQRQGWSQRYLAYVLTDIAGRPFNAVDVSRRERGVREITLDEVLLYAVALEAALVDLLVDDDGYVQLTLNPSYVPQRKRPIFQEGAIAIGLTASEFGHWALTGRWRPSPE